MTMSLSFYANTTEENIWSAILEKWMDITEEYIKGEGEEDCSYWYNERATLSSLAGAIWRLGGYVLEEYLSDKERNGKCCAGRTDMYASIKGQNLILEAKQNFWSVTRLPKDIQQRATEITTKAFEDAKCSVQDGCLCYGITFIVPKMKGSVDDPETVFNELVEGIKLVKPSFMYAKYLDFKEEHNGMIYPGVIAVGTRIKE